MCAYTQNKQAQASRQARGKSEFSTSKKHKNSTKIKFSTFF